MIDNILLTLDILFSNVMIAALILVLSAVIFSLIFILKINSLIFKSIWIFAYIAFFIRIFYYSSVPVEESYMEMLEKQHCISKSYNTVDKFNKYRNMDNSPISRIEAKDISIEFNNCVEENRILILDSNQTK